EEEDRPVHEQRQEQVVQQRQVVGREDRATLGGDVLTPLLPGTPQRHRHGRQHGAQDAVQRRRGIPAGHWVPPPLPPGWRSYFGVVIGGSAASSASSAAPTIPASSPSWAAT